jgi:hypothetical protein
MLLTALRTDTTHDLSQKRPERIQKVWRIWESGADMTFYEGLKEHNAVVVALGNRFQLMKHPLIGVIVDAILKHSA